MDTSGAPFTPELKDIKLPRLAGGIKLSAAGTGADGAPRWRLYHAPAHKYYQLGWSEFECLARFQDCADGQTLKDKVEAETSLKISVEDVLALITFLSQNGLVSGVESQPAEHKPRPVMPFWKKLVHHYLFFTIPLIKPERFLRKTYPYARALLGKTAFVISMIVLALATILTLGRIDEFTHTFFSFFSLEGIILIGVTFFLIKIVHELAHAYTAHKHGVAVPHMGLAFMVMYPVLYTETTQAWRLSSREDRMEIGLAGIRIELMLAAFALLLWNILPAGIPQSLAFGVVAISLIGSLLINLNPLMRFDGYFVFSDYLGIENLHAQGFANARWWIRKTLFGLDDPAPEPNEKRRRFLSGFGLATLIYRFFLFLGIALLVYHIFFKPLGLIMMVIELLWFIILPVYSELKIWWKRRIDILARPRGKALIMAALILLVFALIPSAAPITAPAMLHHANLRALYAPAPAIIDDILVTNDQHVNEGEPLIRLSSASLRKDLDLSKARLEALISEKRQLQSSPSLAKERLALMDAELSAENDKLDSLTQREKDLLIKAPFSGIVRDLDKRFHKGMTLGTNQLLLHIFNPATPEVSAYITQDDLHRIQSGNPAFFRPSGTWTGRQAMRVKSIESVNSAQIDWPALSSVYGGPLPSETGARDDQGQQIIIPRQSLYKVRLEPGPGSDASGVDHNSATPIAVAGRISIKGQSESLATRTFRKTIALLKQESGLN